MTAQGKTGNEFYPIGYLCKDDLRDLFRNNKKAIRKIDKMSDDDMRRLMEKFLDTLESNMFWNDLKIVFEEFAL